MIRCAVLRFHKGILSRKNEKTKMLSLVKDKAIIFYDCIKFAASIAAKRENSKKPQKMNLSLCKSLCFFKKCVIMFQTANKDNPVSEQLLFEFGLMYLSKENSEN